MIKKARNLVGALLMLCLSPAADAAEKQETITLTDSNKIADAMALNQAIDQVSKKGAAMYGKETRASRKVLLLVPR
jgi:hypothetical protein